MTTTVQRVRQLQEEIRAREAMLLELSQQPEYVAEQAFIQDVMDVLEMHSRTLKEAVLAIDPSLLGSQPKAPKAPRKAYTPRKPKDVAHFSLTDEKPAGGPPAPKPSPFAAFGAVPVADHPLEPEATAAATKPAKPAKKKKRESGTHNAKRNALRRVEMIHAGRWYLWTNPHTGQTHEAARIGDDTLRGWAAEFGKGTVEGWKRVVTPEEAGL